MTNRVRVRVLFSLQSQFRLKRWR